MNEPLLDSFLRHVPVCEFKEKYAEDITNSSYFGFPLETLLKVEETLHDAAKMSVAYFSMEYGLSTSFYQPFSKAKPTNPKNLFTDHFIFSNMRTIDYYVSLKVDRSPDLPIYSGGLGVLAGDTLKSAADLHISMAAVGILWHKGYFKQNFWFKFGQNPEELDWDPNTFPGLIPLETIIHIPLKKEKISLRLWKYYVYSFDRQFAVPLILLDSNLPENPPSVQNLTAQLYRSDSAWWRILQRTILGLGGMKAMEALGYTLHKYHLNEGHAALAFVEKAKAMDDKKIETLKSQFAYTCHTPVAAGHDRFKLKDVQEILNTEEINLLKRFGTDPSQMGTINLTQQALNTCDVINAVSQKHGEVTRLQFPQYEKKIQAITNGVHHHTWVSAPMASLFDKYQERIGPWREDPRHLVNITRLKTDPQFRSELWEAHQQNKRTLCQLLRPWHVREDVFTLCWARRIAAYKRPSLILHHIEALLEIAHTLGPLQILYAGKSHPQDNLGFTFVNDMLNHIDSLNKEKDLIRVIMFENYDTYFGKLLASSVDVWLNNPLPPFEASGTSGMKAILNGVLQLSTLDGWFVEAADKNIGWTFGWQHQGNQVGDEHDLKMEEDSQALYDCLAAQVVKLYYDTLSEGQVRPESEWIDKMIHAISQAGIFNTHRMIQEYSEKIWHYKK